jgi:DNA modification methylase
MVKKDLFGNTKRERSLKNRYGAPPFSVLDTKTGDWQRRKKWWLSLGIKSELGRFNNHNVFHDGLDRLTTKMSCKKNRYVEIEDVHAYMGTKKIFKDSLAKKKGVSIFDPVLTELMCFWFCKPKGFILDPFAGGSVRGIVAACLGYSYLGIELSKQQVMSNRKQSQKIIKTCKKPKWIVGDSEKILSKKRIPKIDLIFTCPPYMNLEIYSDHPDDLSNMNDENFINKFNNIIQLSVNNLKDDGFAIMVVGDVRDKDGYYKDFITITKQAFYKIGMKLYNDIILLNIIGSACLRTACFEKSRKVVKTHQNILVFKKVI